MSSVTDSLIFDPEPQEGIILECPWMKLIKKDQDSLTDFPLPYNERALDFGFDEPDDSFFPQTSLPIGEDFVKKCNFRYIPGKLFNTQIVYFDESK